MALENFKVHVTDVVRFVCYGSTLNRSSMSKVLVIVRAAQVGSSGSEQAAPRGNHRIIQVRTYIENET